eukprot:GABV01000514.1.p2 GENE.GABV01000514.1~~GABV01000514.1.p2  ORF type:complete len:224 (+),score=71.00 GABV01000514.1:607-1278(+)
MRSFNNPGQSLNGWKCDSKKAVSDSQEIATLFGEPKGKWEDLFSIFSGFVHAFERSRRELERLKKEREAKEKRSAFEASLKAKAGKKPAAGAARPSSPTNSGLPSPAKSPRVAESKETDRLQDLFSGKKKQGDLVENVLSELSGQGGAKNLREQLRKRRAAQQREFQTMSNRDLIDRKKALGSMNMGTTPAAVRKQTLKESEETSEASGSTPRASRKKWKLFG